MSRGIRLAEGIGEGGEEILRGDLRGAFGAGPGAAGPADDERHAQSTFVKGAFAGAERDVARGRAVAGLCGREIHAAIIAGEDDHGATGEFQVVKLAQHAADVFIEAGEHRGVFSMGMNFAGRLFLKPLHQLRLALDGRVHGVKPQAQKKRAILLLPNDPQGMVGELVGEIIAGLARPHGHVAQLGIVLGPRAAIGPVERRRRPPIRAADVHVIALRLRIKRRLAEMPFADVCGEVILLFK